MLLVASWAAWRPEAVSAWTALGLLAATLVMIVVELFQTYIAWPTPQAVAAAPSKRARRHLMGAAVLTPRELKNGTDLYKDSLDRLAQA